MVIPAVQSAQHGQAEPLRVSFGLIGGPGNDAIGRSFLIAPAILLPLGFVILQTQLLPRAYELIATRSAPPAKPSAYSACSARSRSPTSTPPCSHSKASG